MTNYHGERALRVSQLEIAVADLARSAAFYRDELGFTVVVGGSGSAEVSADGRTVLLRLRELPGAKLRGRTAGLYHVAFLLPSREALGDFLRRAIDTQLPIQGAADHRVSEAIYLQDPDGVGIELYADTDDEGWRDALGRLDMGTDPFDYSGVYYAASGTSDRMPASTVIGHVHLSVHALADSLSFYRDVIGLTVTSDGYPGAFFLASGGYHHHLAINAWERVAPRQNDCAGLLSLTFSYADCETAAAAIDRAKTKGLTIADDGAVDPDGTRIQFTVAS